MEWLQKILEGKLDGDVLGEVVDSVKKEIPLHFVPKYKYNEVAEAKKGLDDAIKERDKQLNDLKSNAGDADTLKQTIEKLQAENKEAKIAYEASVKELKLNTAVETSLKEAKVKHLDLLLGKVDKSKLEIGEDGSIKGLEEQLTSLKTNYADLFETATPPKPAVQGFVPVNMTGSNKEVNFSEGAKLAQMLNQNSPTAVADPWRN